MSRIRRSPQVIWDVVDGVMVLCHTDSAEFFELNPTGAIVWSVCDENIIDDVVERLQEAYPSEDHERLTADVWDLIRSLQEAGLVQLQSN